MLRFIESVVLAAPTFPCVPTNGCEKGGTHTHKNHETDKELTSYNKLSIVIYCGILIPYQSILSNLGFANVEYVFMPHHLIFACSNELLHGNGILSHMKQFNNMSP